MNDLVNLKTYDEYSVLNEDLINDQTTCYRAFINGGPIDVGDGKTVSPKEICYAVKQALMWLGDEFPHTYYFAKTTMTIIFLAHSRKIKTMAVDKYMNLYMNAVFIHNVLKMDRELIGAVIMHEAFHALFNHIERSNNWLAAQGRPKTPQTWHDTNLAADVEVNQTLVRANVIKPERLINEIHGLYLPNKDGMDGIFTNVVPLEIILGNEDYMKKLREMCPPPPDGKGGKGKENKIKTTTEWDKGYKDAWNKIAGLVKKYGAQGAWDVLLKAGLVNGVGEVYTNHDVSEIMGLEFKQVKTLEEYIDDEDLNENLKQDPAEKGQTYEDGFITAFGRLCSTIYQSLQPDDGEEGGGGGGGGDQYDTGLKDDELDDIKLPGKKKKGKKQDGKDGLPGKVHQDGESDDNNQDNGNDQKSGSCAGHGGEGKNDDELTDEDISQLADDMRNRMENGGKTKTEQDVTWDGGNSGDEQKSIGGMGTFEEEGLTDDDLREAGYSEEDLQEINKVRKENERTNTKEMIERAIDRVRSEVNKGSALGQFLEAIEVESAKYKNVWKEILKEFMAENTRRAGSESPNGHNDWIRKKSIARGEYGIHHQKTSKDPQDLNIYVDVSYSMDKELLEIICQSLVVYTQQFKYSGINVCPWGTVSKGVYPIKDFYKKSNDAVVAEILSYVSKGRAECGGGTEAHAIFDAMEKVVVQTLSDEKKRKKDDVHVVITDGDFDIQNIEERMRRAILKAIDGRDDVAEKAPTHTFWMIYDMLEGQRDGWKNEIKDGKLIFINSKVVKNNG